VDIESLDNLRQRSREAAEKVQRFAARRVELHEELHEAELAGDVGSGDQLEEELAILVGPVEAARVRSNILAKIFEAAEFTHRNLVAAATDQEAKRQHLCAADRPLYGAQTLENMNQRLAEEAERQAQVWQPSRERP